MNSGLQQLAETLPPFSGEDSELADEITKILSRTSYSFDLNSSGVSRADGAQLAANSPCEDRFNRAQLLPLWDDEKWVACTVFDGHSGFQTADFLEKRLLGEVQSNLNELRPDQRTDDTAIQSAISKAFADLDTSIINSHVDSAQDQQMKLREKMRLMQIAISGSCALLVLYNPATSILYTACTGDSRAIISQRSGDSWDCVELSEDQKGDNPDEIARIQKAHPGEDAASDGKVLGMAVSRAFGDGPWKIKYDLQLELGKRFRANGPLEESMVLTPPYLTAEPVVTVTKLKQPCFLVMASDGLWDECSSLEVVDLVVKWLRVQPKNAKLLDMILPTLEHHPEPVKCPPGFDFLQQWNGFDARFLEERTVLRDLDNVAVHLLRNACGGNHEELLTGKLAAQPPYAREIRDDMTVQVIFFNLLN